MHPESHSKAAWEWTIFTTTAWIAILGPYSSTYYTPGYNLVALTLIGYIIVLIANTIDIIVTLRSPYFEQVSGRLHTNPVVIRKQWFQSTAVIDVLCVIPFELLFFFKFGPNFYQMVHISLCTRMLKITRWPKLWYNYTRYASISIIMNITMIFLMAHWFACAWFVVGRNDWYYSQEAYSYGWIFRLHRMIYNSGENRPKEVPTILQADNPNYYWTALYFSITLISTVGFGNEASNTLNEKKASTVAMFISVVVNSILLGNINALISRMYARRGAADLQLNELKTFFNVYSMPIKFRHKVKEFYRQMWRVRRGVNYERLFSDVPEDLRSELLLTIYRDFFDNNAFSKLPRDCLRRFALNIKYTYFNAGDRLIMEGDSPRKIFYIIGGVVKATNKELSHEELFGAGSLIGGDITRLIYHNGRSSYNVVAVTPCDLYYIKVDDLVFVMSVYPEFVTSFADNLECDLAINVITKIPSKIWQSNDKSALKMIREEPVNLVRSLSETRMGIQEAAQLKHITRIKVDSPTSQSNLPLKDYDQNQKKSEEQTALVDEFDSILKSLRSSLTLLSDQMLLAERQIENAQKHSRTNSKLHRTPSISHIDFQDPNALRNRMDVDDTNDDVYLF